MNKKNNSITNNSRYGKVHGCLPTSFAVRGEWKNDVTHRFLIARRNISHLITRSNNGGHLLEPL